MDIKKELENYPTILLLIPAASYAAQTIKVAKSLSKERVCYITLNKSYDSLKETFHKEGIAVQNFIFIDGISGTFRSMGEAGNSAKGGYFVESPAALTDLSIILSKVLDHGVEYVLFDSLSVLFIYTKKDPVARFVSNMVIQIKKSGIKCVFFAIESDSKNETLRQCCMFFDKVIEHKR